MGRPFVCRGAEVSVEFLYVVRVSNATSMYEGFQFLYVVRLLKRFESSAREIRDPPLTSAVSPRK